MAAASVDDKMAARRWSESVLKLVRSMNSFHLPGSSKAECFAFLVEGQQVGSIPVSVVKELRRYPEVFTVHQDAAGEPPCRVELNRHLSSYEQRSTATHRVLEELRAKNVFQTLNEWRDEVSEDHDF